MWKGMFCVGTRTKNRDIGVNYFQERLAPLNML